MCDLKRIMMVFLSCWILAISVLKELRSPWSAFVFLHCSGIESGNTMGRDDTSALQKWIGFFPPQSFSLFWCQKSFFALENYLTSQFSGLLYTWFVVMALLSALVKKRA